MRPSARLGVVLSALLLAAPAWVAHAQQGTPGTATPGQAAPGTAPTNTTPSSPEAAPQPDTPQSDTVQNDEQASLELVRKSKQDGKERRIRIVRTGTSDDTGIFTICSPQDDDPEDAPNVAVFSETTPSGVQISIDKNIIRVPLAVVTQRPPKDGEDGSDGRVEASAGTARFLDAPPPGKTDRLSRCAVEALPKPAPDTVFVTQGRTNLKGQNLVYDETDGIARIAGPISFMRQGQKDPLTGSSDRIEVNVDEEQTTLVGNVTLRSEGGRISKAARVEYDDTKNVARLYGTPEQPATSTKGTDTLTAGMILYDLDRNEVYAVKPQGGTITGSFQDGDTSAPSTAAPSAPTTTPRSP